MTDARDPAEGDDRDRRPDWLYLALILVGALLLSLVTTVSFSQIHHPDEIFQVLEPAHALAFGYRMVPYQLGGGPSQFDRWERQMGLLAYQWLYEQEDLCGLSLRGMEWWETGGYAHLHRPVPV